MTEHTLTLITQNPLFNYRVYIINQLSGHRMQLFDHHSGHRVVSLSKIHLPPKKVLVIPRKRSLRPDMTEKLLTGT